ncbi:MAG: D-aminoacylase [SAR324 cluster bacterium]|nr:D-aminoacylase [SAR324 cluster bacterium]MBL7034185.1 D-aminoacylase [SAR324 cluster bacterium]
MSKTKKADYILRNARLIDGTGGPSQSGDVAILDDRLLAVGKIGDLEASRELDVAGKVVCPGFIDTHTHDDRLLLTDPLMSCKVSQGVTTVVTGNCGISLAPLQIDQRPPPPLDILVEREDQFFADFGQYLQALTENPPSLNAVFQVGHTTLRAAVLDSYDRPATAEEIRKMRKLLEASLEAGACGMSTGLFYAPANAAPTSEVIELAHALHEHGALHTTHMRDEGERIAESLRETFAIGTETQIPVVISHHKCSGAPNHGRSTETLALIAQASKGQPVGLDAYPYTAGSTVLSAHRNIQSEKVLISWSEPHPEYAGKELSKIALELGVSEKDAVDALSPGGGIFFMMDEDDVRRILAFPQTMIGSDGLPSDTFPHPRLWGTFPRVLGHYVRDVKLFSLEEAVRKMTSLPAACFGLKDRGILKLGNYADLVVFDPNTIEDSATFDDPICPARGIEQVMVNGRVVWEKGAHTGNRPGRALHLQDLLPFNFDTTEEKNSSA